MATPKALLTVALLSLGTEGISVQTNPHSAAFAAFIQEHGRTYQVGSEEYLTRLAHFQEASAAVHAQNSRSGRLWTAALNHLSDRSPEELERLRGYRRELSSSGSSQGLGLLAEASETFDDSMLPEDVSYKHLQASQLGGIADQGSCGSCWAVASATVLRAHAELYQKDRTFSVQQIVSCTPNPNKCGGSGGCDGATAELAMEYVAKAGAVEDAQFGYEGQTAQCPASMQLLGTKPQKLRGGISMPKSAFSELSHSQGGGAAFGMTGWKKLPENQAVPLMQALYESGPAVVSVGAGGPWNIYSSGIMDSCNKEVVINHAVALVGYGKDAGQRYWTIQNSWGPYWGEGGFARLLRLDSKSETQYCGWDKRPGEGTGCTNGPSQVWVCGSCGILYDSVVPTFKLSESGLLYRSGKRNITA
mmetsp:Transcript_10579/g.23322  ORF Transcript_10579/g.23322 Transcript_10579/m.23322 type:complete len:418 (+) Transcript_10579:123-1376(+)